MISSYFQLLQYGARMFFVRCTDKCDRFKNCILQEGTEMTIKWDQCCLLLCYWHICCIVTRLPSYLKLESLQQYTIQLKLKTVPVHFLSYATKNRVGNMPDYYAHQNRFQTLYLIQFYPISLENYKWGKGLRRLLLSIKSYIQCRFPLLTFVKT